MFNLEKRFVYLIIIIVFFNACNDPPVDAPEIITKITGKITDAKTNSPIPGASVNTNPVTSSITTSNDGSYTIPNVTPGQYTITVTKEGYNNNSKTVTVAEGKTVNADVQLTPIGAELSVSIETLDFGVSLTNLTFGITNKTKIGTITWQISFDKSWLKISPISGTTTTENDLISVSVNRDSVNFGNYSGLITINSDYGSKEVNVSMVRQNPNAPQLTVIPVNLDFGTSNDAQLLSVSNTGTGVLSWQATANSNWIIMSNDSGSTSSNSFSEIQISLNKSNLEPKDYEGAISFSSNGGNETVSVKMRIESGTLNPPTLQIVGGTTQSSISLEWTKIVDQYFSNYKLFRSNTSGVTESSDLITTINDAETTNFTDEGLTSGTTYYYKIFAYNKENISSGSNEVNASTTQEMGSWVIATSIPGISPDISYSNFNNKSYNCLFAVSDNNVWFVYDQSVWHYDGQSWTENFTLPSSEVILSVFFLNQNLGWICGSSGTFYVYTGSSWTKISDELITANVLVDIVASSGNDIWVASSSTNTYGVEEQLFHFDGIQWSKYSIIGIVDLEILSKNNIWALSRDGKVYRYNGTGWINLEDLSNNKSYVNISAISSSDVWLSCIDYGSGSSGLWHYDGNEFSGNYKLSGGNTYHIGRYALDMVSSTEGWSSKTKENNVYSLSYFDGNMWSDVQSPINNPIYSIQMLSPESGWAVGTGGEILRYTK